MKIEDLIRIYPPKRIFRLLVLWLANVIPVLPQHRACILRLAGLKIGKNVLIYKGVKFDTVAPELISIGDNIAITSGVTILTHFLDPSKAGRLFRIGKVRIGNNVFIGTCSVICNSVIIDDGAIIGAGSIVTKDIPSYEVFGGESCSFYKESNEIRL